jgi:hypothetical protein
MKRGKERGGVACLELLLDAPRPVIEICRSNQWQEELQSLPHDPILIGAYGSRQSLLCSLLWPIGHGNQLGVSSLGFMECGQPNWTPTLVCGPLRSGCWIQGRNGESSAVCCLTLEGKESAPMYTSRLPLLMWC